MSEAVVIALITAGLPAAVTVIATALQDRTSRRNNAKQSIESKVMWDEFGWEIFRRYPTNYGKIHDEYDVYHKNGGNGEITRLIEEYDKWFENVDAVVRSKPKSNKTNKGK